MSNGHKYSFSMVTKIHVPMQRYESAIYDPGDHCVFSNSTTDNTRPASVATTPEVWWC